MEGVNHQFLKEILCSLSEKKHTLVKTLTPLLFSSSQNHSFAFQKTSFFSFSFFDSLEQRIITLEGKRTLHYSSTKEKDNALQQQQKPQQKEKSPSSSQEKLEEQLHLLLHGLTKKEQTTKKHFYNALHKLYALTLSFSFYHQKTTISYEETAYALAKNAWKEYFSLPGFIPKTFQFNKPKGGDPLLDVVYHVEVKHIDYEEIMEIQRASKVNSMLGTNANYIDPEANERYKLWSYFIFNQVMSFYYYDFAI